MEAKTHTSDDSKFSIERYIHSSRPVLRVGGGYDGGTYEIETIGYWNRSEPSWGCAAWEERGLADLCGPFANHAEAEAVLIRERDYLESCGYRVIL